MKNLFNHTYLAHVARMHYDIGAGAVIGSAIASSAISAGASITMGGKMNKRAAREAKRTREWQTSEREAQQDWALDQWNRENEWNLNQWNRQNEYNSPAAQRDRLVAAGYSPLNTDMANMADGLTSSSADGGSAPGASMPQLFNPSGEVAAAAQSVGDAFLRYKELKIKQNEANSIIRKQHEESLSIAFQRMRDGLLFKNEFDFLGARIQTERGKAKLTEKQVNTEAWRAAEIEFEIRQMKQFIAESGARMRRMDIENACDKLRVNNEVRKLANEIWLNQKIGYNVRQDTLNKYDEHLLNVKRARSLDLDIARKDYSPISISVLRGMDVVNSLLSPLEQVSSIGMKSALGYKNYMNIVRQGQRLSSTPNM